MLGNAFHWLQRRANPPLFVVTIHGGTAQCTKGEAPPLWIADIAAIADDLGIEQGRIDGVRTWRGVELRFSPDLPAISHQRFRNTFGVHRVGKF